jgi:hypothetical protein
MTCAANRCASLLVPSPGREICGIQQSCHIFFQLTGCDFDIETEFFIPLWPFISGSLSDISGIFAAFE